MIETVERRGEENQYRFFQGTISTFEKTPLITCLQEKQPVAQSAFIGKLNGWISEKSLSLSIAKKSKLTDRIWNKLTQDTLRFYIRIHFLYKPKTSLKNNKVY